MLILHQGDVRDGAVGERAGWDQLAVVLVGADVRGVKADLAGLAEPVAVAFPLYCVVEECGAGSGGIPPIFQRIIAGGNGSTLRISSSLERIDQSPDAAGSAHPPSSIICRGED
jgi:hypothetical protein